MTNARLIAGLERAAQTSPDDVSLRLHLAELLLATGQPLESVPHVAAVLAREPSCAHAQVLMAEALAQIAPPAGPGTTDELEDAAPAALELTDLGDAGPGNAGHRRAVRRRCAAAPVDRRGRHAGREAAP